MVSVSTRAKEKKASKRRELRSFPRVFPAGAALSVAAMAITPLLAASGAQANVYSEKELIEPTGYQVALEDTQSYRTSSAIVVEPLAITKYSATTAEELQAIQREKDRKAAEAKAKKEAEAAAARMATSENATSKVGSPTPQIAPGEGAIRWPLPDGSWQLGDRLGAGRSHQGIDMLAAEGTPIYALAAGEVVTAQNNFYAYGTAVQISHVVDGASLKSTYAHMVTDSYVVSPGEHVEAGQLIGYVGSTGRSTANHLHFELLYNGVAIDGYDFLTSNAG